jgi:hypothetical protein
MEIAKGNNGIHISENFCFLFQYLFKYNIIFPMKNIEYKYKYRYKFSQDDNYIFKPRIIYIYMGVSV